jgi:hypothetical protein
MGDKILINLQQKKGAVNSVRLFFNHDLLDEFDTTESAEIKNYDVDIVDGDVNRFFVQVLNEKTIVENNFNNNVLSSNSVVINSMNIFYKKHNQTYTSLPTFKRDIDPIYQIYAKQNNLPYPQFQKLCDISVGNGIFAWFFVPIHHFRTGLIDPATRGWHNDFNWNPVERDNFFWGWDETQKKQIFKEKIFENDTKKISDDQIVDFLKEYYIEKYPCDNISPDIGINILEMYKFYEN